MKILHITTLVAAFGAVGTMAGNKKKPNKNCEILCDWGYGYCTKSPFNYLCDDRGGFSFDRWNAKCSNHCGCRCQSMLQEEVKHTSNEKIEKTSHAKTQEMAGDP